MSASLGTVIYAAVKPIFKIYFIIGMGFFLAKKNILTVSTCRDISDVIVTAIMPCLIFNKIISNLESSDIKNIGVIFFLGTLLYIVGALLGLATFFVCKSPKAWFGGLMSVGLFPNIADLPIAYMQTLSTTGIFTEAEGNKGVAYVCIFLASQVFYQFSLGLYKLIEWDFRDQLTSDNENAKDTSNEENLQQVQLEKTREESGSGSESLDSQTAEVNPTEINSQITDTQQHDAFLRMRDLESQRSSPRSSLSSISEYASSSQNVRRRRGTNESGVSVYYSLNPTHSRSGDLRTMKSQDMHDVINEYSEYGRLKSNEVKRAVTSTSDCAAEEFPKTEEKRPVSKLQKFRRGLLSTLKNFMAPNSLSLIISLAIAMSPPLKALFVETLFYMPSAPDDMPPLSFVMDITSYVGAASVPLGLLLLGATIARLKVTSMVPGFWKTTLMITACRLIILPIFGVGLTTGIYEAGWFEDDKLLRFVSVLEFGLPNATALVYFTAFYTDPDSSEHLQMDCLAIVLIAQYSILFITLPILVTFTLKVSIGY